MKKKIQDQKRLLLADEALIASALEGQQSAYSKLVSRYQALVRSIVSRYLCQEQDIEEAVQDTFLRAFRSLQGFRGDCKFSTWLTRVGISTALNALRRQKRINAEPVELQFIADISNHDAFEQSDARSYLRQALLHLSNKDRQIVELFYFSEYSIHEIQQQTSWGASDIKSRLCRARQRLREIIEGRYAAELMQRA